MLASTMSHLPRKRPHNQVKKKKDFFVQTRQPVNGVATLRNVVGQRATCYSHKAQSWTRTSLVTLIDLSHRTHEPPSFIHPSFQIFPHKDLRIYKPPRENHPSHTFNPANVTVHVHCPLTTFFSCCFFFNFFFCIFLPISRCSETLRTVPPPSPVLSQHNRLL